MFNTMVAADWRVRASAVVILILALIQYKDVILPVSIRYSGQE